MDYLKKMLRSKSVWSGIAKVVAGVGLVATGEQAVPQQAPELLLAVWGFVDIYLRLKTTGSIDQK